MNGDRTQKASTMLSLVVLLFVVYTAGAVYVAPSMYPDSGWGFLVLKSMAKGAPFNDRIVPAARNIARDQLEVSSWWTPGQFAVPGILQQFWHWNIGQAITATIIAFGALGLSGYYQLYRLLGFDSLLSAGCLLIIVLQYSFLDQFTFYSGGELLLFGAVPWITFYALKHQRMTLASAVTLTALSVLGFF